MLATPELIRDAALPHRLAELLPLYLEQVPLYQPIASREQFADAGRVLEHLQRLPLITKQDIRRDFPHNFLRAGVSLDDLLDRDLVELENTSGTSEERTALLLGRGWWAEQEARALRLNPFVQRVLEEHPAARRVTISSPVCSGDICYTGVPSRADRVVGHALYVALSRLPFLWSETELDRMAEETLDWQPLFLEADPVYATIFALHCERRGIRFPSLKFVLCSYEFVSLVHRRIIERVFRVPVFNLYGSTETGHLLMENDRGEMRASTETAFLEVLNTDAAGVGDLVVTTLTNEFMPLVRYRIGDLVEQHREPYGTRYIVHGRARDAFQLPSGARVTTLQVDQSLAGIHGIAHYQLHQRPHGDWLLRFVADHLGPAPEQLDQLRRHLSSLLEVNGELVIQPTDLLMPESSGKFRLGYPAARA